MYCTTHNQFFHAEINESCPGCHADQMKCEHLNKGPSVLFNSRKYYGLEGEWDECRDCGKLVKYLP